MKTFSTTTISIFPNAKRVTGKPISVQQLIDDIRSDKYRELIEGLRRLKNRKSDYDDLKKEFPAVTLSGHFKTRRAAVPLSEKLIEHSGLLQIDIDHVGDAAGLRDRLREDPFVLFGFISPGGEGIKLALRIDGTRHEDSFSAAERYFKMRYNVTIDPAVRDVARLMFVSHDPDLFVNPGALKLPIIDPKPRESCNYRENTDTFGLRALRIAEIMIEKAEDGCKHVTLLRAANLLGGYVAGKCLDIDDARLALQTAIALKPNVADLSLAYRTIEDGLLNGQKHPIYADFDEGTSERSQERPRSLQFTIEDVRCGDFLESAPAPVDWLLRDSLASGSLGILVADGGAGKGHMALQLGLSVATEIPFLDGLYEVLKHGKALILAGEDSRDTLHRRVYGMARELVAPDAYRYVAEQLRENLLVKSLTGADTRLVSLDGSNLKATPGFSDLLKSCETIPDLRLVVLDPLSRFYAGDENNTPQATYFCSLLERIEDETGANVLISHHMNRAHGSLKGEAAMTQHALRGATGFTNAARWQLNLAYPAENELRKLNVLDEDARHYVIGRVVKKNEGPPEKHFYLKRSRGGVLRHADLSKNLKAEDRVILDRIKEAIIRAASGPAVTRYTISTFCKTFTNAWDGYSRRKIEAIISYGLSTDELGLIQSASKTGTEIEVLIVKN